MLAELAKLGGFFVFLEGRLRGRVSRVERLQYIPKVFCPIFPLCPRLLSWMFFPRNFWRGRKPRYCTQPRGGEGYISRGRYLCFYICFSWVCWFPGKISPNFSSPSLSNPPFLIQSCYSLFSIVLNELCLGFLRTLLSSGVRYMVVA